MLILPHLVNFALLTTKHFKIDESHGISHGMNVLHYSHKILTSELKENPYLDSHRNIIYTSALLHDLCDKKYMNESKGLENINRFLRENTLLSKTEIYMVDRIIDTMSYSKIKVAGYPSLGKYQLAYHIVREGDLLTAYDFDRSIIYNMNNKHSDFFTSFNEASSLFETRTFKHNEDQLFITDFSKKESILLEKQAISRMIIWKELLGTTK